MGGVCRVKVLSWNILQGGGRRVEAIAQSVERHDADVVALTEYRSKGSAPLTGGGGAGELYVITIVITSKTTTGGAYG